MAVPKVQVQCFNAECLLGPLGDKPRTVNMIYLGSSVYAEPMLYWCMCGSPMRIVHPDQPQPETKPDLMVFPVEGCDHCARVAEDAHPGLFTWVEAVARHMKDVHDVGKFRWSRDVLDTWGT